MSNRLSLNLRSRLSELSCFPTISTVNVWTELRFEILIVTCYVVLILLVGLFSIGLVVKKNISSPPYPQTLQAPQ